MESLELSMSSLFSMAVKPTPTTSTTISPPSTPVLLSSEDSTTGNHHAHPTKLTISLSMFFATTFVPKEHSQIPHTPCVLHATTPASTAQLPKIKHPAFPAHLQTTDS